jgi:excisionase family DNA binding protein
MRLLSFTRIYAFVLTAGYTIWHHRAMQDGQERVEKGQEGMRQESEQEFITINQLQSILGVGRTTAYGLVSSGELRAIKVGRAIRVRRADLDRWAERHSYIDSGRK